MNSYKKLFNNVVIFSLGNLGSKIISFLLVPLYTYYLTQSEYGEADIVFVTTSMLLPIVSVAMHEAILRFSLDANEDNDYLFTNSMLISITGYGLSLLLIPIINMSNDIGNSIYYLYVILFLQMLNRILAQYARGIGKAKVFAINGILISFFTAIFNIYFLVKLEANLSGYFWSFILAYSLATIYLIITIKPQRYFNIKYSNRAYRKKLLSYSIPLIPNSIMWWLINGSSRYFINWFVGLEANGIFAVSSRIPSLINLVSQIFTQAWQMSAFETNTEDKTDISDSQFYSKTFNLYSSFLIISAAIINLGIKPLFSIIFSNDFYSAWEPTPFLIIATIFAAFASFLESIYMKTKNTKAVFTTSLYGGFASLILNLLLIPKFGILGAGLSSIVSFFILFVVRYIDTKSIIDLKIQSAVFISSIILLFVQIIILFSGFKREIEIIFNLLILIIILFLNRKIFFIFRPIFKKNK